MPTESDQSLNYWIIRKDLTKVAWVKLHSYM